MISGKTKIFGTLAHPVSHVRTPQALNPLFAETGADAVLIPIEVAPEDLGTMMANLERMTNFQGGIITVPHKTTVLPYLSKITARAEAAGAVNVIRRDAQGRFEGDLLDGEGFAVGFEMEGIEIRGKRIFIAGAGGAASAIAFGLAARGAGLITIANRSAARAEKLAASLRQHFPAVEIVINGAIEGHDLAINGTSLGLKESDPMPFDPAALSPDAVVAEVIMQPEETKLVLAARARGMHVHMGKWMLDGQVREILRYLCPETA